MDIACEYLDREMSLSWALLMRMSNTDMETNRRNSRNAIETIKNDDFDLEESEKDSVWGGYDFASQSNVLGSKKILLAEKHSRL